MIILCLESNPDHLKKWEDTKDQYLAKLLDIGLNTVPQPVQEFSSMTEEEFTSWLKQQDLDKHKHTPTYVMKSPPTPNEANTGCTKTLILPLSLENNSTITGTASVLEEFGEEFGIPCDHVYRMTRN